LPKGHRFNEEKRGRGEEILNSLISFLERTKSFIDLKL
jgi:hypothetical protein